MRELLDIIFSNLLPIIIVVSVVIRVVVGMKNAASARGQAASPGGSPDDDEGDVWSRIKPDDEDDEGTRGRLGSYHPANSPPRPLLAPPRAEPASTVLLTVARPLIAKEPALSTETPYQEKTNPERSSPPAAPGPAGPSPLDRLNRLSPLRRAVVLAEILGSPKGMG